MSTPEEIRRDIERTRAELSDNVNALGDSAKPTNLAREQVDKVKEGAQSLKARIFGDPDDPWDDGALGGARAGVGGARDSAVQTVADARDTAVQAVADAPRQVRAGTRGNPLAAGLIAFGLGALVGSLLPASRVEKDAATRVADAAEPVVEEVKGMVQEAKDHLQPVAQEAAEDLKTVARDAGQNVKDDALAAKDQVADQARSSTESVRSDAAGAVDDTRDEVDTQRSGF